MHSFVQWKRRKTMVVPAGAFLCLSGVLFSVFTQFLFLCFEIKRKCAFKLQWKCPQLQTTANWPDGRLISSSHWTVPVFFFSTSVLPRRYLHCFGAEFCTFCTENLLALFNLCFFSFFQFVCLSSVLFYNFIQHLFFQILTKFLLLFHLLFTVWFWSVQLLGVESVRLPVANYHSSAAR